MPVPARAWHLAATPRGEPMPQDLRSVGVEGLDRAVPAFLDLRRRAGTGTMALRLAPDPD